MPTSSSDPENPQVYGVSVTPLTQCAHWHSTLDIIAIRHACCLKYYACISCHKELENHEPAVWPLSKRDERAVICGQCKHELSVNEYMQSESRCTSCEAAFNPKCKGHWGLYFEMESAEADDTQCGL